LSARDTLAEQRHRGKCGEYRLKSYDERDDTRGHAASDRGEAAGEIAALNQRTRDCDVSAVAEARRPARAQHDREWQHEREHDRETQTEKRERLSVGHAQLRADEARAPEKNE